MSTIYKRSAEVITRREGDSSLAFEQSTGWVCIMNKTSRFLWEHCTGENSVEDLTELLRQHFDLSEFSEEEGSLLEIVGRHLDLMHKGMLVEAIEVEDVAMGEPDRVNKEG
jgi:hypothetical protein